MDEIKGFHGMKKTQKIRKKFEDKASNRKVRLKYAR